MKPQDYLEAARVPHTVEPQEFGEWIIMRRDVDDILVRTKAPNLRIGWPDYTLLYRVKEWGETNMHLEIPHECVMEDSERELRRHMPIWLNAHGKVLVTGLGLGCVVRGLVASPNVDHIDVVEIDDDIYNIIGKEFKDNPKVNLILGDALTMELPGEWDYAWHDIWSEEGHGKLQCEHLSLMKLFRDKCGPQGAWMLPRLAKKVIIRSEKRTQIIG